MPPIISAEQEPMAASQSAKALEIQVVEDAHEAVERGVLRYGCSRNISTTASISRHWIASKLVSYAIPVGLVVVLGIALAFPYPGEKVKEWEIGSYGVVITFNIAVLFILAGLALKTEDIWDGLRAYKALIYGLASILFITPCFGFGIMELPFSPKEFAIGLALFSAMPTTLATATILTNQSYGNGTLALMLTVVSNVIGLLTVPFSIQWILSTGTNIKIDAVALLIKLAMVLLIPLAVGKLIRELYQAVQTFVANHKVAITLFSNLNMLCIVWQNLCHSRDRILDQNASDVFIVILASVLLHITLLILNSLAVSVLRLDSPAKKAIIIVSSQKTLPLAVTVISYLNESEVGDLGLITIPCIAVHMSQFLIDAFIASRWASLYVKLQSQEETV